MLAPANFLASRTRSVIAFTAKLDSMMHLILLFKQGQRAGDYHKRNTCFHFASDHHWCNTVRIVYNKHQQWVSQMVYTLSQKDHWSWAKRLNAQIKHLLFARGDDIFRPRAQQAICATQCNTKTDVYSTHAEVNFGSYEPHKHQHPGLCVLTQTPIEPQKDK